MLTQNLTIDHEAIAAFCERNHIRWMAIFGSAVRDDFGPDSDVDVLVEFEPGKTPGYRFITMQSELSELLHHDVDLLTRKGLNVRIKSKVLAEAEVIYDAA